MYTAQMYPKKLCADACKHSRLASEFHTEVSIFPELQQHHKKSSGVGIGTVNKHIQLTSTQTVGYKLSVDIFTSLKLNHHKINN